ncbi:sulfate adenylyltransferase subunit 1 [Aridibaculum aurantiacum]|uniref:sulfate adenylyltransferase subunit 1 n=1 Tax=Aridibaculum aurantiacum TaxID=2810307 RepID=UPI001A957D94|nr:GTP-binding protein [Aridibaculum aurantiacum]
MDILRIATAGSVDDGKSTLIGRLLYDTKSITKDKLEAVEASSKRKGLDFVDLSLLTDGLIAEREQGITIDVAHIYFTTEKRKYIIADTPGHVEYTRNMITGASNAEASIILVDARNGVWEQTKRHLSIFALLHVQTVFVCVNKMDLVGFDEQVYVQITEEVQQLATKIGFEGQLIFIPIAAKYGDNVVEHSARMNWYSGEPLLHYLEALAVHQKDDTLPARFPVQFVIRPHSNEHHDFRGYAGKLISGTLSAGEKVVVLPSLKTSTISTITVAEEERLVAKAGESVVLQLEDDVDISRGNMIVPANSKHQQVNSFTATLCWMDEDKLAPGQAYLLQHGVHVVKAKVTGITSVLNLETMEENTEVSSFKLNDIGKVNLKTAKPIFADLYAENSRNGAFILINEFSNTTVAVGFIQHL